MWWSHFSIHFYWKFYIIFWWVNHWFVYCVTCFHHHHQTFITEYKSRLKTSVQSTLKISFCPWIRNIIPLCCTSFYNLNCIGNFLLAPKVVSGILCPRLLFSTFPSMYGLILSCLSTVIGLAAVQWQSLNVHSFPAVRQLTLKDEGW